MNNLSNRVNSALVAIPVKHQSLALNSACDGLDKVEADSILTVFIFATIKRSDVKAKPVMMRVTASSYSEARQQLIRDYVISFAGRIPALEKMA
ncbi:host cell division inhibitor Icd-like protein [Yersinia pseudotuberculosis]|uniref:host cell division inhibitor Icd-like protein n=1 Tax=Yersinia pseudotuberculosis TaxID=633 RepID=UPI00061BCA9D|nr:host cell division inhibitor Icd-like protein [Yersinia pseudotuberculosis]AXY33463.1 host cell division inhibitor Icd-like protein [Yersinia pseudotuberculosis]CNI64414.1 phage immunity repressor protein [Yersinia pseudotuberculosis]CNJ06570.1 phage immunity repressor protein [Yersinia pseudotuberculosis]SUQ17620.1 phage immunity repressor protein [Yersinia pseudotuberculosis]